ncbi:AEC family transporter [Marinomonas algicola]|uniref:AEC family transporter n=1 Tax=Marinomonas algicola TaxID=2773454 RepID=UPI001749A4D0|nr:AEC family transporter [Marinomonas algicola]
MAIVLTITAPIFFLILLGFIAVRFSFIPQSSLMGLSRFVLYLALPALIFEKLSSMKIHEVIHIDYLVVYACGGLFTFFTTVVLSWKLLKNDLVSSGIQGVGACMSNSAFIGFPVLLQFFDQPLTQAFVMALMVENLILLPVCLIFIETMLGKDKSKEESLAIVVGRRIATNPLLIALICGLLFSILNLSPPTFISHGLELLAAGAASAALIVIGGSLVGVSIKGHLKPIFLVAFAKLMIFPAIIALLLLLTPTMPPELKVAMIIFAAMPMFSTYPIVCGEYGARSFCASTLLATTTLSFITLSLLLPFLI